MDYLRMAGKKIRTLYGNIRSDAWLWHTTFVGIPIVIGMLPTLLFLQFMYTMFFMTCAIVHKIIVDRFVYKRRKKMYVRDGLMLRRRDKQQKEEGYESAEESYQSRPQMEYLSEMTRSSMVDSAYKAIYLKDYNQKFELLEFQMPKKGEQRCPCPALNALANHNYLPRNGKSWNVRDVTNALVYVYHLDPKLAYALSVGGAYFTGDAVRQRFSLGKLSMIEKVFNGSGMSAHQKVEHDASLSRADAWTGDNISYDPSILEANLRVIEKYRSPSNGLDLAVLGVLRQSRMKVSREQNPVFYLGPKQTVLAYGEVILMHSALSKKSTNSGNVGSSGNSGIIPLRDMEQWLGGRLPEGYRPPRDSITYGYLHSAVKMLKDQYPVPKMKRRYGGINLPIQIKYLGVWTILFAQDLLSSQVSVILDIVLALAGMHTQKYM